MLNPAYQEGYEHAIDGIRYNNQWQGADYRQAYDDGYTAGAEDLKKDRDYE